MRPLFRRGARLGAALLALAVPLFALPAQAAPHLQGRGDKAGAGSTLLYFGGPVVPNAKVYVVFWGDPSNQKASLTTPDGGIAAFYEGVLDSPFIDAWAQYNTDLAAQSGSHSGQPGTDQWIGRGNYAGTYVLGGVPLTGTVYDDNPNHVAAIATTIQATLEAAVANGTLPPSDPNTIYAIYFPAAVDISLDFTATCSPANCSCSGFGAYHNATDDLALNYLVIPDCGYGFLDFTSVSSHELAEATTDRVPTPGSDPDYPQAWNDRMGDEAADLCEATGGDITTSRGIFAVQGIWDQRTSSCQTQAHSTTDFSVSIAPHAAQLATGSSQTFAVQTAVVAGSVIPLALSVQAPAGVTATLDQQSISSGGSARLTVSASSAVKDAQVVVSAAQSGNGVLWIHSAALLVNAAQGAGNAFSLSVSPASVSASAGDTVEFTVQSQLVSGSVPSISLSTAGLSPRISASFNPQTLAAGASSTLTLVTPRSASPSTTVFSVVGSADSQVTAGAQLDLSASTDGGTISGGDGGTNDGGSSDGGSGGGSGGTGGGSGGGSASVKSGCAEAPFAIWFLPLVAALVFPRKRRGA